MPPVVAPHGIFTQPVSAMRKNDLQALCRHFAIDDAGPVITLRQLLKTHLRDNRELLEADPLYARLYPRHGRGRQNSQPLPSDHGDNLPDDNQNFNPQHNSPTPSFDDEWHGIQQPIHNADELDDPPLLPSRQPSIVPATPPFIRSPTPEDFPLPQPEPRRQRSVSFST
jgi:hypothetical protein